MGSRREEERNEKIIRGLMKLPPNRRCINCNILGPQYVCTNFWTFVCMTCSGIHREFTHRVKSISMSKFTSQEVKSLEAGGNQRAREFFLKHWDIQRRKLPDNSKPDKVREFIKSVYVDQKYTAGTISSPDDDSRRASSYHSYSQSPPYDFQYEDRVYGKLTRKPGSDRYYGTMTSFVSSPTRFGEDKFANESSTSRISDFSVSSGARSNAGSPTLHDRQPSRVSPAVANHQDPPVDFFKLPRAPSSPFITDSTSTTDGIRNQVCELSGWADFDLVRAPKPQPIDFLQPTKSFEDHHRQPVSSLTSNNFLHFQPPEPRKDNHNPPIDLFQPTEPAIDFPLKVSDVPGLKTFDPTEPSKDNHNQPIDLFHPTEPAAVFPQQVIKVQALKIFDPTESRKDNHNQPIDLFQPTQSPTNLPALKILDPTEPIKGTSNQAIEPVTDFPQQLASNIFDPVQPTEPFTDYHYQTNNVLPFNEFGPVQATEPINEIVLDDLFSSGPTFTKKISGKSTNPFDDPFDYDSSIQMPVYGGSLSESWFGSDVDVNHGATQMGNLSIGESVVFIGGNPFA